MFFCCRRMTDPLAEPAFTLRFEHAFEGDNRPITKIYPTIRQATTYIAQGYKFWAVLEDPFSFKVDSEACSLMLMVRGVPMGESRPASGRNGNFYVPTRPHRAELASTIKNLVMEKVGFLPLSFSGQRQVRASFMYVYPRNINRTRIADTDNITKFVKDAIEMAGLVTNDRQINEEHAQRVDGGQEGFAGDDYIKETGGIVVNLQHIRVEEDAITIV